MRPTLRYVLLALTALVSASAASAQSLPPGIEKKLEDGKALPPGIEKKLDPKVKPGPSVPEPGAALLFGAGVAIYAAVNRRRVD